MAKGNFNGVLKGKLGNSVFYRLKNSKNKEKQGVRVYVADPSNPQTSGQAAQRAKIAPVVAFYRANKDLLDHSFVAAGSSSENYRRFLHLALASDNIPAVEKMENTQAVPGSYTISEGPLAGVVSGVPAAAGGAVTTSLALGALVITAATTIGQLSQAIEDNNAGFIDGDELLFVAAFQLADGTFFYSKQYVVLNTQSAQLLSSYTIGEVSYIGVNHVALSNVGGSLAFQVLLSLADAGVMEAVAVSHSRQVDGTWVYSTAVLQLSAGLLATYFTAGAREGARRSYMPSASSVKTSDKLLQQSGAVGRVAGLSVSEFFPLVVRTISDQDDRVAVLAALGGRLSNGDIVFFVGENNVPVLATTGEEPITEALTAEYLNASNIMPVGIPGSGFETYDHAFMLAVEGVSNLDVEPVSTAASWPYAEEYGTISV